MKFASSRTFTFVVSDFVNLDNRSCLEKLTSQKLLITQRTYHMLHADSQVKPLKSAL